MIDRSYATRPKTRRRKKRYMIKIYAPEYHGQMMGTHLVAQHLYCSKHDAQRDIIFIKEMVGNYFYCVISEACISNPFAVKGKNKMLESQICDLTEADYND